MTKLGLIAVSLALIGQGCSIEKHTPQRASVTAPTPSGPYSDTREPPPQNYMHIDIQPESFSSSFPTDYPISFLVDMPLSVTASQIEGGIKVTSAGSSVSGKFEWMDLVSPGHPLRLAVFTPTTPWKADAEQMVTLTPTDFSVTRGFYVGNSADASGSYHSVFTTGAKLRPQWVKFVSKTDDEKYTYMRVRFSEPVELTSVLKTFVSSAQSDKIAGAVSDPLPISWTNNIQVREIQYDFAQALDIGDGVSISFSGLTGAKGNQLDLSGSINGRDVVSATEVRITRNELSLDPYEDVMFWNLPDHVPSSQTASP